MIKRIIDWLRQPLGLVAMGIGVLTFFSLVSYGIYATQTSPPQPIEFPHRTHIAVGVQCLYCHPGSLRGPVSGLPATAKCWACHQQIEKTTTSELLKPLVESVRTGQPVKWVPVAQVPDFVQFNHRPHVAAGVNCEECHGDLSKMTIYENPQTLNMGWCLNCHKEKAGDDQEKLVKLTDWGTCHY